MRRAALLALALCACKPAAPPAAPIKPVPVKPMPPVPRPAAQDAGGVEDAPVQRPAPKAGEVKPRTGGGLQLIGHTESILAVAVDPTGRYAASGGLDRALRVWDLEKPAAAWAQGPGDEAITALRFSPDGKLLAVGDRAYRVRLYQLDGTMLRARAHPDAISSIAFSPDGKWLGVAGFSGNADVYPVGSDAKSACELRGRTIDFTDDGKYLVTAHRTGELIVTAFPSCKQVKVTSTLPHLPFAAASGTAALVGTRNGSEPFVLLWNTLEGRMLGKLDRQTGGVTSLELSGDGKRALVASEDRHVRLYDVDGREVVKTIDTQLMPFAAMDTKAAHALIGAGLDLEWVALGP